MSTGRRDEAARLQRIGISRVVATIAFLLATGYLVHGASDAETIPSRNAFNEFPLRLEEWSCPGNEPIDEGVVRNLGVSDYLLCTYRREPTGEFANVYVGYHQRQGRTANGSSFESSIHPPKHCLPGSGWDIVGTRTMDLDIAGLPGGRGKINRFSIVKGTQRQIVYYWYQSRGRVIYRDWRKVVAMAWDRATRGRTDGALVRFTVPYNGSEEAADVLFQDLAALVLSRLGEFVPE